MYNTVLTLRSSSVPLRTVARRPIGIESRYVSVSEVIGGRGGYYAGGVREVAVSAGLGGGGGPISPGELELTLQLEIVYTVQ